MNGESSALNHGILTVKQLLIDGNEKLAIPSYQRPYKWTSKNVIQLFDDIAAHKDKSSYRLGTIVFHRHQKEDQEKKVIVKDIVDGQQRIITLLLAIHALRERRREELGKELGKELSENLTQNKIFSQIKSDISKANIRSNYLEICRIVGRADFTEDHINFLLNKCEVVTFTLKNISEAFQFFDSQNARGRDLEPHDLLKAYHLREFSSNNQELKATTVSRWENIETEKLAKLFSQYLYRIRNWSKGASARYFGKEDIGLFKGVNLETVAHYPYVKQLQIAHQFVDHYNQQYERKVDGQTLRFPFHLDQMIINGRRFFEMIAHYQDVVAKYKQCTPESFSLIELDGCAEKILKTLNQYKGRNRTGDRYVRTMFDCLLIYYIDKFGFVEISRAIEIIFIWSYSLRLKMQAVQLASMDKYVLGNNLFKLIKEAVTHIDFINYRLPVVQEIQSKNDKTKDKTEEIKNLFEMMSYLKRI